MNRNNMFERVLGQRSSVKKSNTVEVMEKLLGKQDNCERGAVVTVRDVLHEGSKAHFTVAVYGRGEANNPEFKGTFDRRLVKDMRELLSKFGDLPVREYDEEKSYIMVYLDD